MLLLFVFVNVHVTKGQSSLCRRCRVCTVVLSVLVRVRAGQDVRQDPCPACGSRIHRVRRSDAVGLFSTARSHQNIL